MIRQSRIRLSAALRLAGAAVALAAAAPASAQAPPGEARVFVTVNGGLQALTRGFSENVVFPESGGAYEDVLSGAAAQEQARFTSDYRPRNGTLLDASGGVRIASHFGIGIGVSRFSYEDAASVAALAPHPFFLDRDRSLSGASPPLTRGETAVHLQALALAPASPSVTVTVFGGPTFFDVSQQLVTDVRFTHEYPYDTAAFASAAASRKSGSKIGFNVGADVVWYFSTRVGIGWLTRYSRAVVELPSAGGGAVEVPAGGLHTAGGLRLRF